MAVNKIYLIVAAIVVVILIVVIIMVIVKRRKKGSPAKENKPVKAKQSYNYHSKYKGTPVSDDVSAPRLKLLEFNDSIKTLSFRFEIPDKTIIVSNIEPNNLDWIKVHKFDELTGKKRLKGQTLLVLFDLPQRKYFSQVPSLEINIVYHDTQGKEYIQPIKYNHKSGVKLLPLMEPMVSEEEG